MSMHRATRSHWASACGLSLLLALSGCRTAARVTAPGRDFGAIAKAFSAIQWDATRALSKDLGLPIPAAVSNFYAAARTGDFLSISQRFSVLYDPATKAAIPELRNALWAPIQETFGAHEVWEEWKGDSALLDRFSGPVLASMPPGSIYFGGTEYGRFVITAESAVRPGPRVFCITQNQLADYAYPSYLAARYGKEIWLPGREECAGAFQRYVEEVQSGSRPASNQIEIVDGRVQVSGVMGVMEINGILCEMIFTHNRDAHAFFVEESYVIDWMYPYLEPHGLIMKLNPQPLDALPDATVARDREFWRNTIRTLEGESGFAENRQARIAFSKLRSAIAGLYAHRKMYAESEAAFRQALRLYPASPEATFRLVNLYAEQGRKEDVIRVLSAFVALDPPYGRESAEASLKTWRESP